MEILGKILGSPARVKIMKLFLLNKDKSFKSGDIAKKSRVNPPTTRRELKILASVNFLKKRKLDWSFNPAFKYTREFEGLLVRSDSLTKEVILDNFKKVGRPRLIITSGIFIRNNESRVDLLIVGDNMKGAQIEAGVRKLEALVGAELTYAIFDTKEYIYRLDMYDKLIRDILDYPHEVILQDKGLLELSTQSLKKAPKLV